MKNKRGIIARTLLTLFVSVIGFMVMAGPSCPGAPGGGDNGGATAQPAPPPVPAPTPAPVTTAPEPAKPVTLGKQNNLEVGRLVLTNANGIEKARLEVLPDGGVGFIFKDEAGVDRTMLGVGSDGTPVIVMRDKAGMDRVQVIVDEDDSPEIDLINREGKIKASLALEPENDQPLLTFFSDGDTAMTTYSLTSEGDPRLVYIDEKGKEQVIIPKELPKPKPKAKPKPKVTPKPEPPPFRGETISRKKQKKVRIRK